MDRARGLGRELRPDGDVRDEHTRDLDVGRRDPGVRRDVVRQERVDLALDRLGSPGRRVRRGGDCIRLVLGSGAERGEGVGGVGLARRRGRVQDRRRVDQRARLARRRGGVHHAREVGEGPREARVAVLGVRRVEPVGGHGRRVEGGGVGDRHRTRDHRDRGGRGSRGVRVGVVVDEERGVEDHRRVDARRGRGERVAEVADLRQVLVEDRVHRGGRADHGSVGRVDDADDRLEGLGVDVDLEELERRRPDVRGEGVGGDGLEAAGLLLPVVGEEGEVARGVEGLDPDLVLGGPGRGVRDVAGGRDLPGRLGLGEDELPGGPGAVERDALVEEGVADVRAEGGSERPAGERRGAGRGRVDLGDPVVGPVAARVVEPGSVTRQGGVEETGRVPLGRLVEVADPREGDVQLLGERIRPEGEVDRRPLLLNDPGASREEDDRGREDRGDHEEGDWRGPPTVPGDPRRLPASELERSALGRASGLAFPLHGTGARSGGAAGEASPPASPEGDHLRRGISHVRVRK